MCIESGRPVFRVVMAISVRWLSTSASQHERSIHPPSPPLRTETRAAEIAVAAKAVPSSLPQLVNVHPRWGWPSSHSTLSVSPSTSMFRPWDGSLAHGPVWPNPVTEQTISSGRSRRRAAKSTPCVAQKPAS